jgi:hypothetical protein
LTTYIVADAGKLFVKVLCLWRQRNRFYCRSGEGRVLIRLLPENVKYHVAQEALNAGLNLIERRHQTSEMPVFKKAAEKSWKIGAAGNNRT